MVTANNIKNICIISDNFIPAKISAAGMIYNLAKEFKKNNYKITCVYGGYSYHEILSNSVTSEVKILQNMQLINSSAFISLRKGGNFKRFLYEILLSVILFFKVLLLINKMRVDLVIWYGPSSLLWPVVLLIKFFSKAKVYYILRDIFPDCLADLGIIKSKFLFNFLKIVSLPQYLVPDVIGVETEKNQKHLLSKNLTTKRVEVLNNWPSLRDNVKIKKELTVFNSYLKKNKKNVQGLYIGNTSVAHDLKTAKKWLYDYCKDLDMSVNLNFFTSEQKIKSDKKTKLSITEKYWGQVNDYFLPNIIKNINFGIVTLNSKLITQNIPGKFVSYIQFGVPVLCFVNKDSSLSEIVNKNKCGLIIDLKDNFIDNKNKINKFLRIVSLKDNLYSKNAKQLFVNEFNTRLISNSIIDSINK